MEGFFQLFRRKTENLRAFRYHTQPLHLALNCNPRSSNPFTSSRVHEFTTSRVQEFMSARVYEFTRTGTELMNS